MRGQENKVPRQYWFKKYFDTYGPKRANVSHWNMKTQKESLDEADMRVIGFGFQPLLNSLCMWSRFQNNLLFSTKRFTLETQNTILCLFFEVFNVS